MKKRIEFSASIQAMAVSDVESALGYHELAAIREDDPNPFFVLLSLAHEGISKSRMIPKHGGPKGTVEKHWAADVIQKLADSYVPANRGKPAQLIVHHDDKNDPDRPGVGEVKHSQTRIRGGKVYAEAIGHLTDEDAIERVKDGTYDTCSIEADIVMKPEGHNRATVTDVIAGTAVAIGGTGEGFSPAFEGAGFVAQVQCAKDEVDDTSRKGKHKMEFTTAEVIAAIVNGDIDINKIIETPQIQKQFKAIQAEDVAKIKDLADKLQAAETKVTTLETSNTDLLTKNKEYESANAFSSYYTGGACKKDITELCTGQNTKEPDIDRMVSFLNSEKYLPVGDTPEAKREHLQARVSNLQTIMSIKNGKDDPPKNEAGSESSEETQQTPTPKGDANWSGGKIPNALDAINTGDSGKGDSKADGKGDSAEA